MKQPLPCTVIAAIASILLIGSEGFAQRDVPRFEIGGQVSLLSRNKPSSQDDEFVSTQVAVLGLGGRFTYNLKKNVALEAEGNFFPERNFVSEGSFVARQDGDVGVPFGHIYQGQFGVKVGKHFKKVGIFVKARPGFVGFTKASHLVRITPVTIVHLTLGPLQFENPEFRIGKATYPSMDVGGVVELYQSRRIVTRVDVGDTIIRYGIYREPLPLVCATICVPPDVFERPAETRHNLQITVGVGVRF